MDVFFYSILIIIFSSLISLFVKKEIKTKIITFLCSIATILLVTISTNILISGKTLSVIIKANEPFGNIPIIIDSLSAFFIIVISIMGILSIIYANGYLKPYIEKNRLISSHCIFLTLLIASMLLVVTVQNALFFFVVWEIMSISSFFLVAFESNKKEVINAAIKYLVYMHISLIFILIAFIVGNINSNSLIFAEIKNSLVTNPELASIFFIFAFIGFGIKAGFVPFHNWLPEAHPAAPSHVSGLMSGVMIKTGIYGILRTITLIGTPEKSISYFVLIISVISALYGVMYALAQHDLKKLLAYHSIENIGIIGIGIGCGMLGLSYNLPLVATLGFIGAILHVLNHSIFKELLFLGAGAVYNKTHTRQIEILGGLFKYMPITAICFLIGAISICGIPPFNGFVSEIIIYFSMLKGLFSNSPELFITFAISLSSLAFVGTMAILCFTKAFSIVFLGTQRSENAKNVKEDVPLSMTIPMITLSVFCILIGIFPKYIFPLIEESINEFSITNYEQLVPISFISNISNIALALIIFVLLLTSLKLILNKNIRTYEVWGCGYDRPNSKMQYTASSFVSPFLNMLKPLFVKKSDIKTPDTIFPQEAHFNTHIEDIEEEYIIKPVIKIDKEFLAKFQNIQSGNLQQYILFGLIFFLILIIGLGFWR